MPCGQVLTVTTPWILGETYFVTIKATNGAGVTAWYTALGVAIDFTPPVIATLEIVNDVVVKGVSYIDVAQPLNIEWLAYDPETGLSDVTVCLVLDDVVAPSTCTPLGVHNTTATLPSLQSLHVTPLTVALALTVDNGVGLSSSMTSPVKSSVVSVSPPLSNVRVISDTTTRTPVLCSVRVGGLLVAWQYDTTTPGTGPLVSGTASIRNAANVVVRYCLSANQTHHIYPHTHTHTHTRTRARIPDPEIYMRANATTVFPFCVVVCRRRQVGPPRPVYVSVTNTLFVTDIAVRQGAVLSVCVVITDIVGRTATSCSQQVHIDTAPPTAGTVAVTTSPDAGHVALWSTAMTTMLVQWAGFSQDDPTCGLSSVAIR